MTQAADEAEIGKLAGLLRRQESSCDALGSPLYAALLGRAAADVEGGGPSLEVLRGHGGDPLGSALPLRMMGAVHRLVLAGRAPALAPHYRGGGLDAAAAWDAFRSTLAEHADELRELVERPVQTNEVGRCAALLPGFLAVARRTGLPLRVLEVGASAGLNLGWDRYRYEADDFAWGDPAAPVRCRFELGGTPPPPAGVTVAARRGCDPAPLDPGSEEGRLTVLSYLWPDQTERLQRARGALAAAAAAPARVDRAAALPWVEARLGEASTGVATVVFHSLVMQYLGDAERERFEALLHATGERAEPGAPLAWLRMEPAGPLTEVRLTEWPGGEERPLARAGYHGDPVLLAG